MSAPQTFKFQVEMTCEGKFNDFHSFDLVDEGRFVSDLRALNE
jgi:hypothetical protein